MSKERIKTVEFPVFNYTVHIVACEDLEESRAKRDKIIGHSCNIKNAVGLHSYNDKEADSYIFLYYGSDVGTIAHECYHVVHRMWEWIGSGFDNELTAYHLGYLTKQAYEVCHFHKTNKK